MVGAAGKHSLSWPKSSISDLLGGDMKLTSDVAAARLLFYLPPVKYRHIKEIKPCVHQSNNVSFGN